MSVPTNQGGLEIMSRDCREKNRFSAGDAVLDEVAAVSAQRNLEGSVHHIFASIDVHASPPCYRSLFTNKFPYLGRDLGRGFGLMPMLRLDDARIVGRVDHCHYYRQSARPLYGCVV